MEEKPVEKSKKSRREILNGSVFYQGKVNDQSPEDSTVIKNTVEIVLLTTYPPRECGIATYSKDLEHALKNKFNDSFKLRILPLEDSNGAYKYPKGIEQALNTTSEFDFLKNSHLLNSDEKVGVVMVQHEFGLFCSNEPAFIDFLESINKPLIIVFHTVLPNPDSELKKSVSKIASASDRLIVMTRNSAEILVRDYGVANDMIAVIPHGTHSVCHKDERTLKEKYNLTDRLVLSTFGLLGPGKSIETSLDALPAIIKEYPRTVFLILGKTHPTLIKQKGEDYREFLESKVEKLGLSQHVRFINEFLPLDKLLEYLQLTDIYLFTSKDPNQAVSGTFSYALSCGCPVISTPIPHALEVLKNNAGHIFDFEDSTQLGQAIINLFGNDEARKTMRLNGLRHIAESTWDNAAIAHGKVFEAVGKAKIELAYRKPEIK
uniref:glycosyltransferase n=1 Tax=Pricia sp. TaxID=2268138 RepID=UPI00359315C6